MRDERREGEMRGRDKRRRQGADTGLECELNGNELKGCD